MSLLPVLLLVLGCRCNPPQHVRAAPDHAQSWGPLVQAAARGELDVGRRHALALGDRGQGSSQGREAAMGRLGGALGFVRFAEDEAELAEAVAAMGQACGSCHLLDGISGPPRPEWGEDPAGWVAWGLVWGQPGAPPKTGDPLLDELVESYRAPVEAPDTGVEPAEAQVRAARVITRMATR